MDPEQLTRKLINGEITLEEWEYWMREHIRTLHNIAGMAASGGRDNMSPALWAFAGFLVLQQFGFLSGFARDIATNPEQWLNGRAISRMRLYLYAEWGTMEGFINQQRQAQGYTEERRVLGQADHCPDCIAYAAQGWQPIGTLPRIGDSVCVTNCQCIFEYR